MKTILRLEELGIFLGCLVLFYFSHVAWWWYLLLLLGPDTSFIGYLGGNKIGAIMYNLFDHKGIAAVIITVFFLFYKENTAFLYTGIVLFGHSSMDRFFGYGLKYFEGFKHTHLGLIGNNKI